MENYRIIEDNREYDKKIAPVEKKRGQKKRGDERG